MNEISVLHSVISKCKRKISTFFYQCCLPLFKLVSANRRYIFIQFLSCVRCQIQTIIKKTYNTCCWCECYTYNACVIVISTFGMSNLIFPYRVSSSTFSFRHYYLPEFYFNLTHSLSLTHSHFFPWCLF